MIDSDPSCEDTKMRARRISTNTLRHSRIAQLRAHKVCAAGRTYGALAQYIPDQDKAGIGWHGCQLVDHQLPGDQFAGALRAALTARPRLSLLARPSEQPAELTVPIGPTGSGRMRGFGGDAPRRYVDRRTLGARSDDRYCALVGRSRDSISWPRPRLDPGVRERFNAAR